LPGSREAGNMNEPYRFSEKKRWRYILEEGDDSLEIGSSEIQHSKTLKAIAGEAGRRETPIRVSISPTNL
jgi:hypothetical protein